MRFRLCGARSQVCDCTDVEAQPCVSRLIADYLDTLRESVLTQGADGGPGDAMSIAESERQLWVTMRAFATLDECERFSISQGCGGFIQLRK
jgi:hypothetical protein